MAGTPGNGAAHSVRLDRLEQDQAETFRRLRVVDRLDERMKAVEEDVHNCAENCTAIRAWVEQQLREARDAETEKHRLTTIEKVALWGAAAAVLAAIIGAIASLAAAGVIG